MARVSFNYPGKPAQQSAAASAKIARAIMYVHRYRLRYGGSFAAAFVALEDHSADWNDLNHAQLMRDFARLF